MYRGVTVYLKSSLTLTWHVSVLTLVLYATSQHLVTLDCVGGVRSGGQCTAERVELTVWGRHWRLEPSLREHLIHETRDRTLRCYATSTMIDIIPNGTCKLRFCYSDVMLQCSRKRLTIEVDISALFSPTISQNAARDVHDYAQYTMCVCVHNCGAHIHYTLSFFKRLTLR